MGKLICEGNLELTEQHSSPFLDENLEALNISS